MSLTKKQEDFILAYLECGNATHAYRSAYNACGMKAETVNRTAKELLDNPKIAARIAELRKPVIEKAQLSVEQHLNDLKRLRDLAAAAEKWGPAIMAETNRGRASGLYVDKIKVGGDSAAPAMQHEVVHSFDDLRAAMKNLLGKKDG